MNNYKFNAGTELENSFDVSYYETYFRNYDAQVGRFMGVDKISEQSMGISPYHFGANNPISFNDPTGLKVAKPQEDYSWFWDAVLFIFENMPDNSMYTFSASDESGGGASVDFFQFSGNVNDDDVMNNVIGLVNKKNFTGAMLYIINSYPVAFNVDQSKYRLTPDNQTQDQYEGAFFTKEFYTSSTGFQFVETIFPVSALNDIAESKDVEYFKYIVSDLYHEFVHIKTYYGLDGLEQIHQTDSRAKEREFIAFYYQLFKTDGLPQLNDFWKLNIINVFNRGNYFQSFIIEDKLKYQSWYNQILNLEKTLRK